MLIADPRHTAADLRRWSTIERAAMATTRTLAHRRRVDEAQRAIDAFGADGYCGVSWGKDSICVAHMAAAAGLPLVWVRVVPIENPDCITVAKASGWSWHEIVRHCSWSDGDWHARGTLESGFGEARQLFGARHVSGVRAEESGTRATTCRRNGVLSASTCRPLAWWTGLDVFGYALNHGLPIHPAYAFTLGGLLDPCVLRVASLGGRRGDGFGRAQWERRYYGRKLDELARGPSPDEREE